MGHSKFLIGIGVIVAAACTSVAYGADGKVLKLDLSPGKDRATLVISHSGTGKFRLFQSEKQSSVIIEAENLNLPPALTKMIDASGNTGPVLQLTPYNSRQGTRAMAKFVIQLRGRADVTSTETPNRFIVEITRKAGLPAIPVAMPALRGNLTEKDEVIARLAASQKSDDIARKLIEVLNTPQEEKKYFGSKVTFEAKDADVPDIFRLVGESSELNIVWDSDVEGAKTSLAVKDLPWDQLLDIVIQQRGYKAMVMGNVVRIMTVETFNKQAKARKEEITLSDELEPVVMAVIPLSFAEAADIKGMITELIQEKNSVGALASSGSVGGPTASVSGGSGLAKETEGKLNQDFKRGRLEVDRRTNSLIVTNTKDSIERMRRLIKELDVPVPQVLIDAKIVIASENFSRQVGISWQEHLTSESGAAGTVGAFGSDMKEVLGGGSEARDANSEFAIKGGAGAATLAFGFGAGDKANVTAALSLAEINGLSKTVASPRIIVNNNKEAKITDGVTISKLVPGGGGTEGGKDQQSAELSLSVTPAVTSRGSVQLRKFSITKGAPVSNDPVSTVIDKKTLDTEVMVDSGATLVLGGIYQVNQLDSEGGIPLLKDLPFIGQLFRTNSNQSNKSELMVFITPQIIDPEASSQGF